MRSKISGLLIAVLAVGLAGCGGGSQSLPAASEGRVPSWFTSVPQDPNYIFAANTSTSQDLQLAIDKATTGGRAEIGRQVEVKVNALQKRFDEEVGVGEDTQLLQSFSQATKTVVSTSLTGSRIKFQEQFKDGNIWRAYVLVEYPIGAANEALMNQIKKNEHMYTRFRASETFKELDDEVQKYEDWKKQQSQPY